MIHDSSDFDFDYYHNHNRDQDQDQDRNQDHDQGNEHPLRAAHRVKWAAVGRECIWRVRAGHNSRRDMQVPAQDWAFLIERLAVDHPNDKKGKHDDDDHNDDDNDNDNDNDEVSSTSTSSSATTQRKLLPPIAEGDEDINDDDDDENDSVYSNNNPKMDVLPRKLRTLIETVERKKSVLYVGLLDLRGRKDEERVNAMKRMMLLESQQQQQQQQQQQSRTSLLESSDSDDDEQTQDHDHDENGFAKEHIAKLMEEVHDKRGRLQSILQCLDINQQHRVSIKMEHLSNVEAMEVGGVYGNGDDGDGDSEGTSVVIVIDDGDCDEEHANHDRSGELSDKDNDKEELSRESSKAISISSEKLPKNTTTSSNSSSNSNRSISDVEQKELHLTTKEGELNMKEEELVAKNERLVSTEERLQTLETEVMGRLMEMKEKEAELIAKEEEQRSLEIRLCSTEERLKSKEEQLCCTEENLKKKEDDLRGKHEQLSKQQENLIVKKEEVECREGNVTAREEEIQSTKEKLDKRDAELVRKEEQLNVREKEQVVKEDQLRLTETSLKNQSEELERKEKEQGMQVAKMLENAEEQKLFLAKRDDEVSLLRKDLQKRSDEVGRREVEVGSREVSVQAKEDEISGRERELQAWRDRLEVKESEVTRREIDMSYREANLATMTSTRNGGGGGGGEGAISVNSEITDEKTMSEYLEEMSPQQLRQEFAALEDGFVKKGVELEQRESMVEELEKELMEREKDLEEAYEKMRETELHVEQWKQREHANLDQREKEIVEAHESLNMTETVLESWRLNTERRLAEREDAVARREAEVADQMATTSSSSSSSQSQSQSQSLSQTTSRQLSTVVEEDDEEEDGGQESTSIPPHTDPLPSSSSSSPSPLVLPRGSSGSGSEEEEGTDEGSWKSSSEGSLCGIDTPRRVLEARRVTRMELLRFKHGFDPKSSSSSSPSATTDLLWMNDVEQEAVRQVESEIEGVWRSALRGRQVLPQSQSSTQSQSLSPTQLPKVPKNHPVVVDQHTQTDEPSVLTHPTRTNLTQETTKPNESVIDNTVLSRDVAVREEENDENVPSPSSHPNNTKDNAPRRQSVEIFDGANPSGSFQQFVAEEDSGSVQEEYFNDNDYDIPNLTNDVHDNDNDADSDSDYQFATPSNKSVKTKNRRKLFIPSFAQVKTKAKTIKKETVPIHNNLVIGSLDIQPSAVVPRGALDHPKVSTITEEEEDAYPKESERKALNKEYDDFILQQQRQQQIRDFEIEKNEFISKYESELESILAKLEEALEREVNLSQQVRNLNAQKKQLQTLYEVELQQINERLTNAYAKESVSVHKIRQLEASASFGSSRSITEEQQQQQQQQEDRIRELVAEKEQLVSSHQTELERVEEQLREGQAKEKMLLLKVQEMETERNRLISVHETELKRMNDQLTEAQNQQVQLLDRIRDVEIEKDHKPNDDHDQDHETERKQQTKETLVEGSTRDATTTTSSNSSSNSNINISTRNAMLSQLREEKEQMMAAHAQENKRVQERLAEARTKEAVLLLNLHDVNAEKDQLVASHLAETKRLQEECTQAVNETQQTMQQHLEAERNRWNVQHEQTTQQLRDQLAKETEAKLAVAVRLRTVETEMERMEGLRQHLSVTTEQLAEAEAKESVLLQKIHDLKKDQTTLVAQHDTETAQLREQLAEAETKEAVMLQNIHDLKKDNRKLLDSQNEETQRQEQRSNEWETKEAILLQRLHDLKVEKEQMAAQYVTQTNSLHDKVTQLETKKVEMMKEIAVIRADKEQMEHVHQVKVSQMEQETAQVILQIKQEMTLAQETQNQMFQEKVTALELKESAFHKEKEQIVATLSKEIKELQQKVRDTQENTQLVVQQVRETMVAAHQAQTKELEQRLEALETKPNQHQTQEIPLKMETATTTMEQPMVPAHEYESQIKELREELLETKSKVSLLVEEIHNVNEEKNVLIEAYNAQSRKLQLEQQKNTHHSDQDTNSITASLVEKGIIATASTTSASGSPVRHQTRARASGLGNDDERSEARSLQKRLQKEEENVWETKLREAKIEQETMAVMHRQKIEALEQKEACLRQNEMELEACLRELRKVAEAHGDGGNNDNNVLGDRGSVSGGSGGGSPTNNELVAKQEILSVVSRSNEAPCNQQTMDTLQPSTTTTSLSQLEAVKVVLLNMQEQQRQRDIIVEEQRSALVQKEKQIQEERAHFERQKQDLMDKYEQVCMKETELTVGLALREKQVRAAALARERKMEAREQILKEKEEEVEWMVGQLEEMERKCRQMEANAILNQQQQQPQQQLCWVGGSSRRNSLVGVIGIPNKRGSLVSSLSDHDLCRLKGTVIEFITTGDPYKDENESQMIQKVQSMAVLRTNATTNDAYASAYPDSPPEKQQLFQQTKHSSMPTDLHKEAVKAAMDYNDDNSSITEVVDEPPPTATAIITGTEDWLGEEDDADDNIHEGNEACTEEGQIVSLEKVSPLEKGKKEVSASSSGGGAEDLVIEDVQMLPELPRGDGPLVTGTEDWLKNSSDEEGEGEKRPTTNKYGMSRSTSFEDVMPSKVPSFQIQPTLTKRVSDKSLVVEETSINRRSESVSMQGSKVEGGTRTTISNNTNTKKKEDGSTRSSQSAKDQAKVGSFTKKREMSRRRKNFIEATISKSETGSLQESSLPPMTLYNREDKLSSKFSSSGTSHGGSRSGSGSEEPLTSSQSPQKYNIANKMGEERICASSLTSVRLTDEEENKDVQRLSRRLSKRHNSSRRRNSSNLFKKEEKEASNIELEEALPFNSVDDEMLMMIKGDDDWLNDVLNVEEEEGEGECCDDVDNCNNSPTNEPDRQQLSITSGVQNTNEVSTLLHMEQQRSSVEVDEYDVAEEEEKTRSSGCEPRYDKRFEEAANLRHRTLQGDEEWLESVLSDNKYDDNDDEEDEEQKVEISDRRQPEFIRDIVAPSDKNITALYSRSKRRIDAFAFNNKSSRENLPTALPGEVTFRKTTRVRTSKEDTLGSLPHFCVGGRSSSYKPRRFSKKFALVIKPAVLDPVIINYDELYAEQQSLMSSKGMD